jgi:hypothetical protein
MPNDPDPREQPKRPASPATRPRKPETQSEQEVLREQARTEIEERPYLDTEGGE